MAGVRRSEGPLKGGTAVSKAYWGSGTRETKHVAVQIIQESL